MSSPAKSDDSPRSGDAVDIVADVPALAAAAGQNNGNASSGENNTNNTGGGGADTGTVIGIIGADDSGVQLAVQVDGTEKAETEAEAEEMEVEQQLATNAIVGQGGGNGSNGGGDPSMTDIDRGETFE